MKNIRIIVSGKVHKVGYRYYVKQIAESLNIKGTVKYTSTPNVEIEASGSPKSLDELINFCRIGCVGSEVKDILVTDINPRNYSSFNIDFSK